jgi:hypothetical protein
MRMISYVSRVRRSTKRGKGQTLNELLALLMIISFMIAGLLKGVKIGNEFGVIGAIIGAVVGSIAGLVAALALILLIVLIYRPYEAFWKWWRPYPPVCENGTCVGYEAYETMKTPDEVRVNASDISPVCYRCKCGNHYGGGTKTLWNRWVRIMPDGTTRPYLKHRSFGRWKPDREDL